MNNQSDSFVVGIERAVLQATHGRVGRLHVDHCGHEIVLHGRCPSLACKMLAEHAALLLIGDATLVNRIEVH